MSSKKNDFFGGFFDFNGDGKTDIGEEWIAFQIFQECMKDEKNNYTPLTSSANKKKKNTPIINKKTPLPEIYTEEELKVHCNSRKTTIISSLLAGLIMMIPVCIIVWASYAAYDPRNSASGFLIALFTIAGLIVSGVILHTVWHEISNAIDEIAKLKQSYEKNK